MRKLAPARVQHRDDHLISCRVYIMRYEIILHLHEGTLDAKFTRALPVPVHPEVKFIPKRMVVPRLHDTVERFRT